MPRGERGTLSWESSKSVARRTERRTETREVDRLVGGTCDECGAEFKFLDDDTWPRIEDTLPLRIGGYYGGYTDHPGGDPSVELCSACADRLVAAFPSIKKAMNDKWLAW